ncbi:MAG: DUF4340 domain-containing protein [Flavobacteriales bacterium]|nr:DUF4340 domain-containing protein [Flavobacteriales bacterium]
MKKSLIILLLLLAGATTWWLIRDTSSGTSDKNKTEFEIKNVEDVTKIFISNKREGYVLLEKKGKVWFVNGKFEVFKPTIDFFLNETLKKIRVKGPVPLPARQNVISSMASTATKVEIYLKGELYKTYYVGQPTSDMTGTYMYLQNSKEPYITHIPGFDGFLTSRYPIAQDEWITKVIFDYKPEEIKSVEILFPDNEKESFSISRKENLGDFDITVSENAPVGKLNYAAVKSYFNLFNFKYCEGFENFTKTKIDSILRSTPYCVIGLKDIREKTTRLRVYRRPSSDRDHGLYDKNGKRLVYDPSRYFAFLNGSSKLMVIQDIVFAPIMLHYSDLLLKKNLD